MSERRLYLVRHGTPDFGGRGQHFYSHTDYGLGARGRLDAQYVGAWLDEKLGPAFTFFSSPLRRCLETAEPLALRRGLNGGPTQVEKLKELGYGSWEGRSFAEVAAIHGDDYRRHREDPYLFTPAGAETFEEGQARVVSAMQEILEATTGDLVVVAHAMMNLLFLSHVADWPLTGLKERAQPYGCINELAIRGNRLELLSQGIVPRDAPDDDQVERLRELYAMPALVRRHTDLVRDIAVSLAQALNEKGAGIALDVLDAACRLHDIARGEKKHAQAGAARIRWHGFPVVAQAIADHQDLPVAEKTRFSPSSLLYLADKLCLEDELVGIEERFDWLDRSYADPVSDSKRQKWRRRRADALWLQQRVEEVLGKESWEQLLGPLVRGG